MVLTLAEDTADPTHAGQPTLRGLGDPPAVLLEGAAEQRRARDRAAVRRAADGSHEHVVSAALSE